MLHSDFMRIVSKNFTNTITTSIIFTMSASKINDIFVRIQKLTNEDGQKDFISICLKNDGKRQDESNFSFEELTKFLHKIFQEIDLLAAEIRKDDTILVSVRNQKLLRTCFQLVTLLGFSVSLLPGLGINLNKRCSTASVLTGLSFTDEEKYEILVSCTDFISRCYEIPVLKNLILTFHMSDYLAALIQLSFAPLKKPGAYRNFVMTEELYGKLNMNKQKYVLIYENLVTNCFQPILMKELLVLQGVDDPPPPMFVKKVIVKEMSRRLLAPGGLLSLIRCFIESYNIDTGFEWKKIDMICKIVAAKHGSDSEESYLLNISSQLIQILAQNNTHYLVAAVACVISLHDKYPENESVKKLVKEIFQVFDDTLISRCCLPGTVLLAPSEIEHKVNILHACISITKLEFPSALIKPNLYILFLLGMKCTKNEELKIKIKDVLIRTLEQLSKDEISVLMNKCLFGEPCYFISVEEYESGLLVKCLSETATHETSDAIFYLLNLFNHSSGNKFAENIFQTALQLLIELSNKRQSKYKSEVLMSEYDDLPMTEVDEKYANMLQLLTEISNSPKVVTALKQNPSIVLRFIEYFISNHQEKSNEECVTVALVLLNTILSNSEKATDTEPRLSKLTPVLHKMIIDGSEYNKILCKEALSLINTKDRKQAHTPCNKAIADVFDDLLPVRAHGIMELTKLIDATDPETISMKHYIFCLFQENLKDSDSYIYLACINGIAALGTHCTEDVLQVLCKEFLQTSSESQCMATKDNENKISELRMKIGDIIVKVTRRLGEMAVVHKTTLLNTMLCGCRDDDPLIRTSALSNLAEIALVLHFKIGSIIYEVLLCIWSIIESDKAVECRRAAVMVITSLLKGLGKDTLIELKENLLPIYRTLKRLYGDESEDSVVRLHAQLALEELNDIVKQFLFPEVKLDNKVFVIDKPDVYK